MATLGRSPGASPVYIPAGSISATKVAADIATQAELDTVSTVASAALPKAGGAMTGAITTNSTFDGTDIAVRDALHAPKASPAFTGTPTGITAAHLTGAAALPAAVTGGSGLNNIGLGVSHSHATAITDGGGGLVAITFGGSATISSSINPNGSKFLILVGGGRMATGNSSILIAPAVTVKEGSDFTATTTTTEGEVPPFIGKSTRYGTDASYGGWSNTQLYTNDSGSAQNIWIRTCLYTYDSQPQNPAWSIGAGNSAETIGFVAIKIA